MVQLEADFRDYYDYVFEFYEDLGERSPWESDLVFRRIAYNCDRSIGKAAQFKILARLGFRVPLNGRVKAIAPELPNKKLVIYTDTKAHAGEGKLLLPSREALEKHPDCYCSEYLDHIVGRSRRLLKVGEMWYSFWYYSTNDWRSNCGNTEIIQPPEERAAKDIYKDKCRVYSTESLKHYDRIWRSFPLIAIDLVNWDEDYFAAIDFNTAPGLRWTGMDKILSAGKIYGIVERFLKCKSQLTSNK
jgi:hypothetical protein